MPKLRLVGVRLTAGAVVPVPLKVTLCGLSAASSLTVIAPVRAPPSVGVKVTEIVQFAETAKDAGHVFVWLKSPAAVTLLIASAAGPVFVNVTDRVALELPTNWFPKLRLVGFRVKVPFQTPLVNLICPEVRL